ncbi:hypothetical protein C8J56DRAFT_1024379 [Mycena floridula]|nr:hypothetical protein C8J56DRAFT_1024379 [Mycena floridula]
MPNMPARLPLLPQPFLLHCHILCPSTLSRTSISTLSSTLVKNSSEDKEDQTLVLGRSRNAQQGRPSFSKPSTSRASLSLTQMDLILEQFSDRFLPPVGWLAPLATYLREEPQLVFCLNFVPPPCGRPRAASAPSALNLIMVTSNKVTNPMSQIT